MSGEDDSNNETIHVVLTLAIVATVTAISFVTDCLGIVLELNVRIPKDTRPVMGRPVKRDLGYIHYLLDPNVGPESPKD